MQPRKSGVFGIAAQARGVDPWTSAEFFKMSGAGNDFIIFDNRRRVFAGEISAKVRRACSRRLAIGADGLLLLESSPRASFRLTIYNSDGSRAPFCANGTRCAARFAFVNVIAGSKMTIETDWEVVGAEVQGGEVTLSLPEIEATPVERTLAHPDGAISGLAMSVGVPHFVAFVSGPIEAVDVEKLGRAIRRHPDLAPEGANVHFVRVESPHEADIRSYERGVEAETLACGSGVIASALAGMKVGIFRTPIHLRTRSGIPLSVAANVLGGSFTEVRLTGDARIVYRSQLSAETLAGFPEPLDPQKS
jgi:diaminopimelate epimerase